MTKLELNTYLFKAYDGRQELVDRFHAWLGAQPAEIQKIAHEFPIGQKFTLGDGDRYVVGWYATDVIVSPMRLRGDRQHALAASYPIPVEVMRCHLEH